MLKSLEVALRLQLSGFTAGLGAASAQADAFGKSLDKNLGATRQQGIHKLGIVALGAGAAMLAGFGLAAKAALDFEKQMSGVQAATGATGGEMDALRQQALDLGQATTFSASEAAVAQAELAKAGLSTSDILGGALAASLNLAAAGQLDLGTAATYTADALTIFDLKAGAASHVADVLAAGAGKSSTDVDGLAQALSQTGLVADQFDVSLDDTVATLALFASEGLKGSDAGTSLKTALQRLSNPTDEVATLMSDLGIDVFGTNGEFVGMAGVAGELQDALAGMTTEQRTATLAQIGGADAVRALSILYESGEDGLTKWIAAVSETGYASEQAALLTDNLAGDLEQLGGALESALIEGGSKATGILREPAQGATAAVTGFSELPSWVQTTGVAFLGLGGAATTAVGAVAVIGPKIAAARVTLEGMGAAGQLASRGIGAVGAAAGYLAPVLAAGAVLYMDYAQNKAEAAKNTADFVTALQAEEAGLDGTIEAVSKKMLADSEIGSILRENSADYDVLTDGIRNQGDALEILDDKWSTLIDQDVAQIFEENGVASSKFTDELIRLIDHTDLTSAEQQRLIETLDGLSDDFDTATDADKNLSDAEVENSEAADKARAAQLELSGSATTLEEVMRAAGLGTENANAALENYLDTLRASVDPLFGMVDALGNNRDAQAEVAQAQADLNALYADGGASADEIAAAEQRLADAHTAAADSGYDVWAAVAELNTALETGAVDADRVRGQLQLMEEQGLIPAGTTALIVAGQFDEAIGRAEALGETDPNVEVTETGNQDAQVRLMATKDAALSIPTGRNTTVTARDQASTIVTFIRDRIAELRDKTVSIHANYTYSGFTNIPGAAEALRGRWGMVTSYARGGIEAHVARGEMVRYAEPQTGGEAFIPRLGDPSRSRKILDTAADWYGLDVVERATMRDTGMGGWAGGPTYIQQTIAPQVVVSDELGPIQIAKVQRIAEKAGASAARELMAGGGH